MNLTYIKDLIPRPAVASAAVAGSLYSMTESPSLSLCLGAIAGVSCCFFPEETKGLCTAFTAIASAQAVKNNDPTNTNPTVALFLGTLAGGATHFFLSREPIFSERVAYQNMDPEQIRYLNQMLNQDPNQPEKMTICAVTDILYKNGSAGLLLQFNAGNQGLHCHRFPSTVGDPRDTLRIFSTNVPPNIEQIQVLDQMQEQAVPIAALAGHTLPQQNPPS